MKTKALIVRFLFGTLIRETEPFHMTRLARLQALKTMLQEQAPVRARRTLGVLPGSDSVHPVRAGQVVEVCGKGRWSWVVRLLRESPGTRALWMEGGAIELFPPALEQGGVDLSRILFLEKVKSPQAMEILLEGVRSRLFEWVVLAQELMPHSRQDAQIRKIQISAEECGSALILFSARPTASFGVQVRVEAESGMDFHFSKVKGGTGG
jgi:hypothetical protein